MWGAHFCIVMGRGLCENAREMSTKTSLGWLGLLCGALLAGRSGGQAEDGVRAAVLGGERLGLDQAWIQDLEAMARASGFEARRVDYREFNEGQSRSTNLWDLLILPAARTLPLETRNAVKAFWERGGHLWAMGMPAWGDPSVQLADRWIPWSQAKQLVEGQRAQTVLVDFAQSPLDAWRRNSDRNPPTGRYTVAVENGGGSLHAEVDNLSSWETFSSPELSGAFPGDHTLTCFEAKGGPQTTQLSVEWMEADGSRWIATVPLGLAWKTYALPPEAFRPWTPPTNRGGPEDSLKVMNARRLTIGLALSHTAVPKGRHEYWMRQIGTAPSPLGQQTLGPIAQGPQWEPFGPSPIFFPVSAPARLVRCSDVLFDFEWRGSDRFEASLLAAHPRARGVGFGQDRSRRWQPLLAATGADGDYRGAVAVLQVPRTGSSRQGIGVVWTPNNAGFYRQEVVRESCKALMQRLRRGVFLVEGGAEFFSLFPGQSLRLGAVVANHGLVETRNLTLQLTVTGLKDDSVVKTIEKALVIAPKQDAVIEETWQPPSTASEGYRIQTRLMQDGTCVDQLTHETHVWAETAAVKPIEIHDGGFRLEGRPWKAHGVNYMPSSGIALGGEAFEHWVGRGAYDPEVIGRDLGRIKAMGLNAVSVFVYYRSLQAQHMVDFIRQCRTLDLRVNLSLRPGTPMDFRWNEIKALIEHYRLARNAIVFALDLAWEPSHYDHAYQQRHNTILWNDWIIKKRGSVAQAEEQWQWTAPRSNGRMDPQSPAGRTLAGVPEPNHLFQDGPWRRMTADYRLFLDELLAGKYGSARELARSSGIWQPVSFRMQMSGDPTHTGTGLLPYDFWGLSGAVDLWEPEAYGRIGGWEEVKPGHFTAAYARLCDPSKPVVWAEMGYSVWEMATMAPSPEKLSFGARYYRDFYRMLRESGADGVFFWWYPGGFRLNENSDFGILNPDGTDREITRVIREEGSRFLEAAKPSGPTHWIEVDRDRDARGLNGIYEAVKSDYWKAVEQGKQPRLKWARKPGS